MTVLHTLNFVAFNPLQNNNPIAVRRRKLIAKIDEHNVDVFELSYYIEPQSRMGVFSAVFTKELQRQMILALQRRVGQSVKRSN